MIGKPTIERGASSLLVAASALAVAVGTATGAPTPIRTPGYRLHASLTPVASATGDGRFDAVLARTWPLPAPHAVCPPPPRMGPCVIGGDGPPVPTTGVRRVLVWRLGLTGITGPATGTVRLGLQGAASPILSTLCTGCRSVVKGKLKLTADQAQQLLKGNATVDVQAGSGELTGKVTVRRSTH